eukprot:2087859-Alexandrium_andersonii.AAC.1
MQSLCVTTPAISRGRYSAPLVPDRRWLRQQHPPRLAQQPRNRERGAPLGLPRAPDVAEALVRAVVLAFEARQPLRLVWVARREPHASGEFRLPRGPSRGHLRLRCVGEAPRPIVSATFLEPRNPALERRKDDARAPREIHRRASASTPRGRSCHRSFVGAPPVLPAFFL